MDISIEHITITEQDNGFLKLKADEGYCYYDSSVYNEESAVSATADGEDAEPVEIHYFTGGIYSPYTDFSKLIVVEKGTVDETLIY